MPQRRPNPYLYIVRAVLFASGQIEAGWYELRCNDAVILDIMGAALDGEGFYSIHPTANNTEPQGVFTDARAHQEMYGLFGEPNAH